MTDSDGQGFDMGGENSATGDQPGDAPDPLARVPGAGEFTPAEETGSAAELPIGPDDIEDAPAAIVPAGADALATTTDPVASGSDVAATPEIALAKRRAPLLVRMTLWLTLASWVMAALAMLGTRLSLWGFPTGVTILRWAMYAAVATLILGGVALYRRRGRDQPRRTLPLALLSIAASLVLIVVPLQQRSVGARTPPIHDVTTDTDNPPVFVAIAQRRADAPNPITYGGPEVARLQNDAYPDIRPVILNLPRDQAYRRAYELADQSGWRIIDADEVEGRIEATARTFWFGLREDVVVRLTPLGERTVVDVRSSSRAGESDRGSNARRVRAYLQALSS